MRTWLSTLVVLSLATVAQGAEPRRQRTLVADLANPSGLPTNEVATASELLRTELAGSTELQVIGPQDVGELLSLDKARQAMGCESPECLGSLSTLGGVSRLVGGTLAVLDPRGKARTVIQLRLLDTGRGTVLRRVSHVQDGKDLLGAVRLAARSLLREAGTLHLTNQVPGGEVFVAGRRVGEMPLQPFAVEELGEVELRVEHVDHLPYAAKVEMAPKGTTRHALQLQSYRALEEARSTRRAWGYGTLAGALVFGGASAAGFVLAAKDHEAYQAVDLRAPDASERLSESKRRVQLESGLGWAAAGVGVALLGTSVGLLVSSSGDGPKVNVALGPGGAGVAVSGAF